MNIEFDYDITDCDPEELGKEIFETFNSNDIGICINAIFTDASSEAKDKLRKALGVEEKSEPTTAVFYEIGDRFTGESGIYTLSRLTTCGVEINEVALVKIEGESGWMVGYIWKSKDYSVKDPDRITKEEFSRIANGNDSSFTLIKK